jgi:hypothetical protein
MDANQKEMKENNNEKFEILQITLVSRMDIHQEKMDALRADMKDNQKERTACQEVTEDNPEKMEPNPEMMLSVAKRQEVPEVKTAVRSS